MLYNQANTGMPGIVVADVARRSSDGLIAIASNQGSTWPYTGGVSTFNGTTWTHYTPDNSPLTHWQVVAVEFDANGNLWASPLSEGVVQIMIGEHTEHRRQRQPLPQLPHRQLLQLRHQQQQPRQRQHPTSNTDCYYYTYSKAYPITEGSFYTAASRNTAAKALIAPVVVQGGASQKTGGFWQAMPSQPVVETSCCVHENAERSKHHRPNRFLENVGASDPSRQAVGSAFWCFNPSRPCSSSQLRNRLCGTSAADRPIFLHDIRAGWRTNRAQRAQEGGQ